jgi:hypothetical protein
MNLLVLFLLSLLSIYSVFTDPEFINCFIGLVIFGFLFSKAEQFLIIFYDSSQFDGIRFLEMTSFIRNFITISGKQFFFVNKREFLGHDWEIIYFLDVNYRLKILNKVKNNNIASSLLVNVSIKEFLVTLQFSISQYTVSFVNDRCLRGFIKNSRQNFRATMRRFELLLARTFTQSFVDCQDILTTLNIRNKNLQTKMHNLSFLATYLNYSNLNCFITNDQLRLLFISNAITVLTPVEHDISTIDGHHLYDTFLLN